MKRYNSAFTLVELAIVIVIIGLLVGGVLQGQELIKQAEIRAQIKQFESFDTASLLFREKYKYLPGDITDGMAASLAFSQTGSSNQGNNRIDDEGPYVPTLYAWREGYFYFVHLSQAKLIKENLRGVANNYSVGTTFPKTAINESGIAAVNLVDGLYWLIGPTLKNDLSNASAYTLNSPTPSINSQDAFGIDSKIDDGVPSTGIVRAVNITLSVATNFGNDTTSTCVTGSGAAYNLSLDSLNCRIVVKSKAN